MLHGAKVARLQRLQERRAFLSKIVPMRERLVVERVAPRRSVAWLVRTRVVTPSSITTVG